MLLESSKYVAIKKGSIGELGIHYLNNIACLCSWVLSLYYLKEYLYFWGGYWTTILKGFNHLGKLTILCFWVWFPRLFSDTLLCGTRHKSPFLSVFASNWEWWKREEMERERSGVSANKSHKNDAFIQLFSMAAAWKGEEGGIYRVTKDVS